MAKEALRDILPDPDGIAPEAYQALVFAEKEARDLGHRYVGTEHLLLSLLRGNNHAATVLKSLGINLEKVRSIITRSVNHNKAPSPDDIPFTPRFKRVVKIADQIALDQHKALDAEELLLGLMHEGESGGAGIVEYLYNGPKEQIAAAVRTQFPPNQISTSS